MTATFESRKSQAAALSIATQAFIDGQYVDAASGATFDCSSVLAPAARRSGRCRSIAPDAAVSIYIMPAAPRMLLRS